MTLDFFGHRDEDIGTTVRYSVPNLAAALARRGHAVEVHLLTSGKPQGYDREGVRYQFHACVQPPLRAARFRFARQLSWSMARAIRPGRWDLVHFHGVRQMHFMYAIVAWWAARCGVPLVAQDRGGRVVGRIERFAQGVGLRNTRVVMASSEGSAREIARLGFPAERISIVPNGVDLALFGPGEVPRLADEPMRVLYVSRLTEEKDPMTMVEGVKEFARRGHAVHVTVISQGHLKEKVLGSLAASQVPVDYVPFVPQGELPVYYRRAHVYLLTSRAEGWTEGWNQTILEAMACGVPVVYTDVIGARDAAGGAGIAVPPGSLWAIASALEALYLDETLRLDARARGIARAGSFSWDAVASLVDRLYRGALS